MATYRTRNSVERMDLPESPHGYIELSDTTLTVVCKRKSVPYLTNQNVSDSVGRNLGFTLSSCGLHACCGGVLPLPRLRDGG